MAIIKTTNRSITGIILPANLGSGTASASTYLAGDQSYKALSEYDDNKVVNDISTLALHQATNNNSAKYNLTNSNVDVYQDSSAIANLTNVARDTTGEYVSSVYEEVQSSVIKTPNTGGIYCNSSTLQANNNTNFTQEGWAYFTSVPGSHEQMVFSNGADGYGINMGLQYTPAAYLRRLFGNGSWSAYGDLTAFTAAQDTWYHFAFTKTSSGVSFFVNGTRYEHNNTSAYSYNFTTQRFGKGVSASSHNVEGYLTEWRVSDVVRYDGATYTVPTSAFVSDSNTLLLVHSNTSNGSTTFTDSSSNGLTVGAESSVEHSTAVASPLSSTSSNATGSYESTAQTANASVSTMSGVVTYTNASGTATLNTDIVLQVSADNGSTWQNATLTAAGTFSSGVLQAVTNDVSVTAGTQLKYKMSFANQASGSKVTRINGVSLSY